MYVELFFMEGDILAHLDSSNGPPTLACQTVPHLSAKDTFNPVEFCVYLGVIFYFRVLSFNAE